MVDDKELGRRLRKSRLWMELSQTEVAKEIGIHRPSLTLVESGERRVSAIELKKLADLYKVPIEDFFSENPERW